VRAPFSWWLVLVAVGFAALALDASGTYGIAVPAAFLAVVVAGLAVADAARRVHRPRPPARRPHPAPASAIRAWLTAGAVGREELVLFLDRLDRRAWRPLLATRSPQEVAAVASLPPEAFRRYLEERLAPLEGTA
jgi:hypothetical protein